MYNILLLSERLKQRHQRHHDIVEEFFQYLVTEFDSKGQRPSNHILQKYVGTFIVSNGWLPSTPENPRTT